MKAAFVKSWRRCGGAWTLLSCLALLPLVVKGADTTWDSRNFGGFFTTPPQIDATNFYNEATWSIVNPSPFTTAHTLNYTNVGNMASVVGWEFDWGPATTGPRNWAANFVNNSGNATISAQDGFLSDFLQNPVAQSFLWISATNIVNKGLLAAGANGEIILKGKNINLSHSALEITPLAPLNSSFNVGVGGTNFTSDSGFYYSYWNPTNSITLNEPLWDGTTVFNPLFPVGGPEASSPCGLISVSIPTMVPVLSDSVSNNSGILMLVATNASGQPQPPIPLATNQFRQAVFVAVSDTNNIFAADHYSRSPIPTNYFSTTAVQLSALFTNVITGQTETNYIYIVDCYASYTNGVNRADSLIFPGADCNGLTFTPNNYAVQRQDPTIPPVGNFAAGAPGMGPPPSIFLYDPLTFSNAVLRGRASILGVQISNEGAIIPTGASVTNLTGRIRVYSDNLNLNQTKVRGEGQISIQTTNLTSSANAALDCQNLSFNLSSASGSLNFANLAPPLVRRLHGSIGMITSLVTNYITIITPNWMTNTAAGSNGPPFVESDLTNVLQININTLVVDARGLSTTIPVTVQNFTLHGTNMVVTDSVTVDEGFILDGSAVTLLGNLTLSGLLQNWIFTNAPSLRYFTNNGSLSIPNGAHFGDDGPTNYLSFVNNGFIISEGQSINSADLQLNFGSLNVAFGGGFYAVAQTGKLNGAFVAADSDIQFTANSLQIGLSQLSALGALDFAVPNLSDGGASQPNLFLCENGFNLWTQPVTGALLGTTIHDVAPGFAEVDHVWAGKDLGASVAGFANNAAINTLVLNPQGTQNIGYEPLYAFFGATGGNGLYVSNLDLSLLTDYANEIQIDPTLTIYFATANLNPSVVISPSPDAEHFLDGQFGGRLRWVGVTSFVKKQPTAFTQKFQLSANYSAAAHQWQLTENIMPGQTNITEASTDLLHWVSISTNIGSYSNFGPATIVDPNSQSYRSRFYRFKIQH